MELVEKMLELYIYELPPPPPPPPIVNLITVIITTTIIVINYPSILEAVGARVLVENIAD
jgi:hypothetical protein